MTKPLFSLPRDDRFHQARAHVGETVVLVESSLRERRTAKEHRGTLVTVASSMLGTGTELAILREDGLAWDQAYPLAQIFSIEEAE